MTEAKPSNPRYLRPIAKHLKGEGKFRDLNKFPHYSHMTVARTHNSLFSRRIHLYKRRWSALEDTHCEYMVGEFLGTIHDASFPIMV